MKHLVLTSLLLLGLISCAQTKKKADAPAEKMQKVESNDKKVITMKGNFPVQKKVTKPAASQIPESTITCTAGTVERVLEIRAVNESGCEVLYTKNGETKSIANASVDLSYCETIQTRVSKKLEDAGFSCQ